MSEMVERVARAIVVSRGAVHLADEQAWPKAVQHYREMAANWPAYAKGGDIISDAFRDARAAIEAMREPTESMVDASWRITKYCTPEDRMRTALMDNQTAHRDKTIHRWAAMITAALNPPPSTVSPSEPERNLTIRDDDGREDSPGHRPGRVDG